MADQKIKVHPHESNDYLSIDFTDGIEAKTVYEDGIIVRYDKKGHVIGIDITDFMNLMNRCCHLIYSIPVWAYDSGLGDQAIL